MTYQIYYIPKEANEHHRGNVMFDIEYYIDKTEEGEYFSELSCLPCVEGLTLFLKDAFENDKDFDYQEFIKEGEAIQEIRGLLYERYNNKPKPYKDAWNFHYHVFVEVLEETIDKFADKYKLCVNMD